MFMVRSLSLSLSLSLPLLAHSPRSSHAQTTRSIVVRCTQACVLSVLSCYRRYVLVTQQRPVVCRMRFWRNLRHCYFHKSDPCRCGTHNHSDHHGAAQCGSPVAVTVNQNNGAIIAVRRQQGRKFKELMRQTAIRQPFNEMSLALSPLSSAYRHVVPALAL
jgi:hypothetical protein